jgi:hypothetical protein
MCAGACAHAVRHVCHRLVGVCPGSPYMRSTLKFSKPGRLRLFDRACAARSSWMRPSVDEMPTLEALARRSTTV